MDLIEQLKQWVLPMVDRISPYAKEIWGLLNDYAYLRAGILVFIGYLVAKFLNKHIPHLLTRLAQHVNFRLGEEIAKRTRPFIFQIIFLTGVGVVASSLELSETEDFIALACIKSLIIIFFIVFLNKLIKLFLQYLCEKDSGNGDTKIIQPTTLPLFENMVLLFLALGGIHQVFGVWNIDMTALLASAGIAGLAIGMASKDTLSDVIAGMLILTDAPYRVGDVIQVGAQVGSSQALASAALVF
jgi:small-conductance mechanosensitive channel